MEGRGDGISGKRLHLQLTEGFAIHRVSARSAKTLHIEILRAVADFLIRRKPDSQRAMRNLRMRQQVFNGRHDLGDAGLVVRTQQGGARGGDDVIANLVSKVRIALERDHRRRIIRQHDVLAGVIAVKNRLDALPAHFRRGVDVRQEADHRHVLLYRGSQAPSRTRSHAHPWSRHRGRALAIHPPVFAATSSCPGVLGKVSESSLDWVSILT